MAYTKNYPGGWKDLPLETTPILAACLDNIETQYDSAVAEIAVDANLSVAAQDAITKRHAQNGDTALGAQTANLNMNTHKITGVVDPVDAQDAATKTYVDTQISGGIPAGVICMWGGLLSAIPTGWALCDGGGGRPDLRSKFIKGSAAGVDPGVTGGSATHTHADHDALVHAGSAVGNHSSLSHSGCSVDQHTDMAHYAGAVSSHVVTQPSAHSSHNMDDINEHTLLQTVLYNSGGTLYAGTVQHLGHTGTFSHSAHSGTAVADHTFTQPMAHAGQSHNVTQASSHTISAHSVTQPNNHSISAHATANNEPVFYSLAFIIKT